MRLTESLDRDIAAYEQRYGCLTPTGRDLVVALAEAGDRFHDLGMSDASAGRCQRPKECFIEWAKKDQGECYCEENLPIVDLMYMCYTDGYNSQREGAEWAGKK